MPVQATPFPCPYCGSDAKVTRSTRLLTDVTIRERTCDGQERHRFKTRVMEETVLDGQDQNSFLYELAFQNAQS